MDQPTPDPPLGKVMPAEAPSAGLGAMVSLPERFSMTDGSRTVLGRARHRPLGEEAPYLLVAYFSGQHHLVLSHYKKWF